MNFLDILKTSAVNLWRNKGRTILTIIAISIGAFTVALTSSVNTGVNSYIDKQLAVFGSGNSLEVQAKQETSTLTDEPQEYKESDSNQTSSTMKMISDSDIEKIRKVKGVKSSEGYKTPTLDYIQYKDGKKLKTSSREVFDSLQIDLAAGSAPDNDSNELELSLPQNMVSPLGFSSIEDAIGKTIKIQVTSQATGEKNI